MSSSVEEHYANLLAAHYSWMSGVPFVEKVAEQERVLAGVLPGSASGVALDLGCGPGYQSVALARLGYSMVIACDTSPALLRELKDNAAAWSAVRPVQADLRTLPGLVKAGTAAVIVCMGDTLTHLRSHLEVARLFADARAALAPGGVFVITYRDLTHELQGPARFIPVRSDEDRILTCFLEYESADTVLVHDLLHLRDRLNGGGWKMHASCYRKLRLAKHWVHDALLAAGFGNVTVGDTVGRMALVQAS
jgi:SAM-dependent methyltransferase